MTSACCHRSGTQLARSGSEASPMPTTGMLMVRPQHRDQLSSMGNLGDLWAWDEQTHSGTTGEGRVVLSHPVCGH